MLMFYPPVRGYYPHPMIMARWYFSLQRVTESHFWDVPIILSSKILLQTWTGLLLAKEWKIRRHIPMSCVLSWLVGKRTKGGPLFVRGKCSLAGLSFLFIANNITLTTVYTVTKLDDSFNQSFTRRYCRILIIVIDDDVVFIKRACDTSD